MSCQTKLGLYEPQPEARAMQRRRSSPDVTYLCTVYVLYGYYASATFLSSVDFTKKKKKQRPHSSMSQSHCLL